MLHPRTIHLIEQLGALLKELGRELAGYRRELRDGGVSDPEAWALLQRMEERLMGPVLDKTEEAIKDIEGE